MNLIRLNTINFRNIIDLDIQFNNGLNILYGNNAQGKTNILEAMYFTSTAKSFRNTHDENLIHFSADQAKVNALVDTNSMQKEACIKIFKNDSKKIYLNNNVINRHADFIGHFIVSLFCPEDLMIIKGDPSFRRRFLDILFCQTDKWYLDNLIKYQRVLKQRNTVLKRIKNTHEQTWLEPWNDQYLQLACTIMEKRSRSIRILNEMAGRWHKRLNREHLSIAYHNPVYTGEDLFAEELQKAFQKRQQQVLHEEMEKGFTLLGPHRDDLDIYIDAIHTRHFSSQGQKRSAAISLRLAEVEYIHSVMHEYPVLLLDDVFSELDAERKNKLIAVFDRKVQTFITGTDLSQIHPLSQDAAIFKIQEGKAVPHKHD